MPIIMRPTIASEIWIKINICPFGQKIMPVINFLLLSCCAVDKDIVHGDENESVGLYIWRPTGLPNSPQCHRQTILNMLDFLGSSSDIGQRQNNMLAARALVL